MRYLFPAVFCLAAGFFAAVPVAGAADTAKEKQYQGYWYQGAEINRYALTQQQYGQPRPGNAVFIFVTEPFDEANGVKYEQQSKREGSEPAMVKPALKLNAMRRFLTGVYPYSLMTSVFTPFEPGYDVQPFKVTFSAQDWCGQSWYQLNQRNGGLDVEWRSYFEKEGDGQELMTDFPVEDNVWNLIRLAPAGLPTGNCLMVPGFSYQRLAHRVPGPAEVELKLEKNGNASTYTMTYPKLGRVLAITFESEFPHKITGWRERRAKGADWTEAKLTHSKIMPYWEKNQPGDTKLREGLGLPVN